MSHPASPAPPAQDGQEPAGSPESTPGEPRPLLRETVLLVALVWAGLAVLTALLHVWLRQGLVLDLLALLVGAAFTLVALFDFFWRRVLR